MDALAGAGVRALLLDIEGTTTPLEFVTRILFPFARARLREHLSRDEPAVRGDLAALRAEWEGDRSRPQPPPEWDDDTVGSAVRYCEWLMDQDSKSTALKAVQGRIWADGYRDGALEGDVYPDVPAALARWRRQGRDVAIFSSGSVLAQKLLFGHTPAGDLTPFLSAFFDTTTGKKREAGSYAAIAAALGLPPRAVLFLSDVVDELHAAREAGLATGLCVRAGGPPAGASHPVVHTFDDVCP